MFEVLLLLVEFFAVFGVFAHFGFEFLAAGGELGSVVVQLAASGVQGGGRCAAEDPLQAGVSQFG